MQLRAGGRLEEGVAPDISAKPDLSRSGWLPVTGSAVAGSTLRLAKRLAPRCAAASIEIALVGAAVRWRKYAHGAVDDLLAKSLFLGPPFAARESIAARKRPQKALVAP